MKIDESLLQTYRVGLAEKLRHYEKLFVTVFRCQPIDCGVEYMGSAVPWAYELRMRHERFLKEPHFVVMLRVPAGVKDDTFKGNGTVGSVDELETFLKMRCQFLESRCETIKGSRVITLYWAEAITDDYSFGFRERVYGDHFCSAGSPGLYEWIAKGNAIESYKPMMRLSPNERCFVAEWVLLKEPDSVHSFIQYARMLRESGNNFWGHMLVNEYDKRFAGRDSDLDLLERTFPKPIKEHAAIFGRPNPAFNDFMEKLFRDLKR